MLSDKEIIALFFQRNEWAIREMSYKYGAYCTAIAKNILDSYEDCQECVNDTWHNAWNAIPPKCPECLKSFLGRITRNLSYNKLKSLTALKRGGGEIIICLEELEECIPAAESIEQVIADKELEVALNHFLKTLSKTDCDIFLSRYWYSNSLAKISKMFSIKENTVKQSLYRSRQKLKTYFEKEGIQL